jgi:hypothetical protein
MLDEKQFKEDVAHAPWHVMDIFDTLDEKCDYWSGLVTHIVDEHLPLQKKKVRSNDVPYMTTSWKNAIRDKRKAAKQYALN